MTRITIYLNEQNDCDIEKYIKEHHIKRKSNAIQNVIAEYFKIRDTKEKLEELEIFQKQVLYKINLYGKLLEQLFVNMGFSFNEQIEMDQNLKQFYEQNNKYGNGMN